MIVVLYKIVVHVNAKLVGEITSKQMHSFHKAPGVKDHLQ